MQLSIIVPVHNMASGNKLTFCIDSLLGQINQDGTPLKDYEIICVDDASTDESPHILQKYEQKYKDRIRVKILTENVKQGGARNRGLEMATGEFVGFMDSDDWAAPEMFATLLNKAKETGADVVGCDYQLVSSQTFAPGKWIENNCEKQTGKQTKKTYQLLVMDPGSMVIKIYRTRVIREKKLCFPEHILYEDNAAAPIWMLSFTHFEHVKKPLYYYYQHDASTVHVITKERLMNRLTAGEVLFEEAKKRGFYEEFHAELQLHYLHTGFANTLFSYAYHTKWMSPLFLSKMRKMIRKNSQGFKKNPYYDTFFDAEQKKLMELFDQSAFLFWVYDTLLMTYRRLRSRE